MIKHINPYAGIDQTDQSVAYRINAIISRVDYDFITMITPLHGSVQCIVGTLIKNFVNQLKINGITEYNPEAIQSILQRCADSGFVATKPIKNVKKRVAKLHNNVTKSPTTRNVQK